MSQIPHLLRALADEVDTLEGHPPMPVIYDPWAHEYRTLATRALIDSDGAPGRIEICSAGYANVLAAITLGFPGNATALVDGASLTFSGFPRVASVEVDGDAAVARIVSATGKIVASGLTVGPFTVNPESSPDIELSATTVKAGMVLTARSARVGPAVSPPPVVLVPPVLSAAVASATSPTTAAGSVSTDQGGGTLYGYASPLATVVEDVIKTGQAKVITTAGAHAFTITGLLASTNYWVHYVHVGPDGSSSAILVTPMFATPAVSDTTPPILSVGASAVLGSKTASFGASTNEGNGTAYVAVTTNPTAPTAPQVRAGQNHLGQPASFSANQIVSAAGLLTQVATGLTAATAYYGHWTQRDGSGNDADVLTTPAATTEAGPALTSPTSTQTGQTTATIGVTTDDGTGSLYLVVTTSATVPSSLQIRSGQDHTGAAAKYARTQSISSAGAKLFYATGLQPITTYYAYLLHRDSDGSDSAIASTPSFITAASPPVDPPPPAPVFTDVLPIILTDLGKIGPNKDDWSGHLKQNWRTVMGDWLDSAGTSQGEVAFSEVVITAIGEVSLDVTQIVQSGAPIFLRMKGKNSPTARFAARSTATPPRIVATNAAGATVVVDVLSYATWSSSSTTGTDTYALGYGSVSTTANGAVSYSAGLGVTAATLVLTCTSKGSANGTLGAYKCDASPCRIAGGGAQPALGLRAQVASEAALSSLPDVFLACDFSTPEESFSGWNEGANTPVEFLDDPDAAGRKIARGKFVPTGHGSMNFSVQLSQVDLDDPRRPIAYAPTEVYQRMYVLLEEDWLDVWQDAQKSGVGTDQRFGWWNQSGYWQNTTGNGGIPGTGLKVLIPPGVYSGQNREQWEYQGHSQRMEFGQSPESLAHPYVRYRPTMMYTYHLDQPGNYGSNYAAQGSCVEIGKWVCIELYTKTNSIVGPYDTIGNGEAVGDGVMRWWLDGVVAAEFTNMRWRRHPDIGMEGPWAVWYYGGRGYPPHDMHFRMKDFACASKYIGPNVAGTVYPATVDPLSTPPVTDGSLTSFASAIGLAAASPNRWIDTNIKPGKAWAERSMIPGARDATQAEVEPGPADVGNFTGLARDTLVNSCGAAWFPDRKQFFWFGGGHGGWPGNEVYWVDVPTRAWGRLTDPSPMERWPEGPVDWAWRTTDNTPTTYHTYNGIVAVPSEDAFYSMFGSPWPSGNFPSTDIWKFHIPTKTWTKVYTNAMSPVTYARGPEAHYVPSYGKIAIGRPNFWRWFDPSNNTVGPVLSSQSGMSNGNSVATPTGIYTFGNAGGCQFLPYANIGVSAPTSVNTTTHPRIRGHARWLDAGHQWNSFFWDATRNMVIAWSGSYTSEPTVSGAGKGKTVYAIDFANDHLYEFVVSGGTWATSQSLGTFTKWQHLVDIDAYIGLNTQAVTNGWMVFKPGTMTRLT